MKIDRSKLKAFKFYVAVLPFSFCVLCLSIFPGQSQALSERPSAEPDEKSSNSLLAKSPTTDPAQQLWQARISTSKDEKPRPGKNELRDIIKRISSIEFKTQNQTFKPVIVIEPTKNADSAKVASALDVLDVLETASKEPLDRKQQKEDQLPTGQITDQTLQILKKLSQTPEQLRNPFELAEILFIGNFLAEAAACYTEALNRTTADQTDRSQNRAWVLFQIGNCLQNTDPTTAMRMYRQLISEYPDLPWADVAKAKSELIDWYLKNKPDELINECKSQITQPRKGRRQK